MKFLRQIFICWETPRNEGQGILSFLFVLKSKRNEVTSVLHKSQKCDVVVFPQFSTKKGFLGVFLFLFDG